MAQVPLSEAIPREYLAAEQALRRLGVELDRNRPAGDSDGWHWYPASTTDPLPSTDRIHYLLLDTSIIVYNTGVDWLELTLYVAWGTTLPNLIANAAVEVACWCAQNHNMHPIREAQWDVTNSCELANAFAAGTAMLSEVLDTGPYDPSSWRIPAGLPDAPSNA